MPSSTLSEVNEAATRTGFTCVAKKTAAHSSCKPLACSAAAATASYGSVGLRGNEWRRPIEKAAISSPLHTLMADGVAVVVVVFVVVALVVVAA